MKQKIIHTILWLLVNTCRIILAGTLVVSGIAKVVDPRGFEYKLTDYTAAFGLQALNAFGLPLLFAIALSTFEFLMGISLLFGISRKGTSRVVTLMMVAMTALTLYLAIENPVADCGCFGEAIILTNWQTFYKNVVLLICAISLCIGHRYVTRLISVNTHWMVTIYSLIFAIGLATYALLRLPVIDFRAFHIGANLREEPQFETTFILEKEGIRQEFSEADYPYEDTAWVYVDTRTTQLGENHEVEMADLHTGEDMSRQVIERDGYTLLLIMPALEEADNGLMAEMNNLYDYSQRHGYQMVALTASSKEAIEQWRDLTGAEYTFYHADAITLKTMIRSNPGLILVKDGIVANKWSRTNLPKDDILSLPLDAQEAGQIQTKSTINRYGMLALLFFVPIIAITTTDRICAAIALAWRQLKKKKKAN